MENKEVKEEDIAAVISSFAAREAAELFETKEEDLEKYWYFKFDLTKSLDWNIYRFSDSLEMYKRFMRRWEEHHNGSRCVVERVRDKYLMPKIKEFRIQLEAALIAQKGT